MGFVGPFIGESVLTAQQRAQFRELGFVRLPTFSLSDAARMEDAVWAQLLRVHGIRRGDPTSWISGNAFGLSRIEERPAFLPIANCCLAIDDLLGAGTWNAPKRWGAFLVTFPSMGRWDVPAALWHVDFPYALPPEPLAGVKVFTFISSVPAHAGGTLIVAGSHRVVERFIDGRCTEELRNTRQTRLELLASHAWLRELTSSSSTVDRVARFMDAADSLDGVAVRVVELTGEPGDVVLTHPWVLHCAAPNRGPVPRFMRTIDIYRRDAHPAVSPRPAGWTRLE